MPKVSTSYKPGQSGNPGGRPKKEWTMTGLIKDALDLEDEQGVPRKVTIAKKLSELASKGDMIAIKEINNRVDGMSVQKNILAGDEDNPISIDISGVLNKVYGKTRSSST